MMQCMLQKLDHIYDTNGHKESVDSLLQGAQTETRSVSLSNGLGRLAQGIHDVKGNDVVDFIPKSGVLSNRIVTYANMVCD